MSHFSWEKERMQEAIDIIAMFFLFDLVLFLNFITTGEGLNVLMASLGCKVIIVVLCVLSMIHHYITLYLAKIFNTTQGCIKYYLERVWIIFFSVTVFIIVTFCFWHEIYY